MATRLTSNQKIMGSTPIVSAFFFFLANIAFIIFLPINGIAFMYLSIPVFPSSNFKVLIHYSLFSLYTSLTLLTCFRVSFPLKFEFRGNLTRIAKKNIKIRLKLFNQRNENLLRNINS